MRHSFARTKSRTYSIFVLALIAAALTISIASPSLARPKRLKNSTEDCEISRDVCTKGCQGVTLYDKCMQDCGADFIKCMSEVEAAQGPPIKLPDRVPTQSVPDMTVTPQNGPKKLPKKISTQPIPDMTVSAKIAPTPAVTARSTPSVSSPSSSPKKHKDKH